ncbi:MAG TPA: PA0069 family radical SAM protein [Saprospiraceae bacterium]|nr:PA0069 family radical SAM protein [Saprospiraceae bacterium]
MKQPNLKILKGRGAQINPANRFHEQYYETEWEQDERTEYITVHPKTILNKVDSPDIGMAWSMNPYQGCEHGCVYCYARNTHNYWGYSAGLDFEQKILVKKNAAKLLEQKIQNKNWEAAAIMLSGNTDCYQPAEAKFGITREILEVLWKYRHPVGLITKNSLILRDLDLLKPLAEKKLLKVSISLTSLDEAVRRMLEPRTASVAQRLKTIEVLAKAGISVNVMLAPIIPGINSHEVMAMAKKVADLGARSIAYTIVRLNGDVAKIFEDWIRKMMPARADKVLNKIKECHGGQLSDSRFKQRMVGEGHTAEIIRQQVQLARRLYFSDKEKLVYDTELHQQYKSPQLKLNF